MKIRRSSTGIRRSGRVMHPALVVLWMGLITSIAPSPLRGQDSTLVRQDRATRTQLNDQELRYNAAVLAYEQALAAELVVFTQWDAALDSVTLARQSGVQGAFDRASERAMLLSRDLERMERRVQQTLDSLDVVRSGYLSAMDGRLSVLLELQESSATVADFQRYEALIADLGNQFRELEAASESLAPEPVVMQGVLAYSPRDTPSRLRNKIEIAERRISQIEAEIEEADRRIGGLEQRMRMQRQQDNFRTTLGRFDDTRVPVGPPGESRSQGEQAVSDTTGVRTAPQTLADQLEAWQTLRGQLDAMLERLVALREELESHLGAESQPRRPGAVDGGSR